MAGGAGGRWPPAPPARVCAPFGTADPLVFTLVRQTGSAPLGANRIHQWGGF